LRCTAGSRGALPELLKLADDLNPTIRFKAVGVLGSIRDGKAFEKLKQISAASNDLSLRVAALKGLIAGGERPDPDLLTRAFDSNSQDVKLEALKALQLLSDDEAKRYLLLALDDAGVPVRLGAALQTLKRFSKPKRQ
jgi:HEAT repeat protein